MLLIILHILLSTNVVDSVLVEFPNNTAVTEATDRTKFRCRSDQGFVLKWFIQPNDTAQRQNLADGDVITSEQAKFYCTVHNGAPGQFNLILSIKEKSAQTYTCQEPDTHQERSAELIILEPTRIGKEINASHVILDCNVTFRGNWAPELEWSHNGTSVVEGVDASVVPNQNVSSFLVISRNDRASAGNYTCTTRFDLKGKPNQTTDTSVPSYMEKSMLTIDVEDLHPDTRSGSNSKAQMIPKQSLIFLLLVLVLWWQYSNQNYCFHYKKKVRKKIAAFDEG